MKNIQKTNKICYCFGGEIYPPKGPEKNTVELVMHTLEIRNSLPFVTNWKSGTGCLRRIFSDVSADDDSSIHLFRFSKTFPVSVGS